MSALFLDSELSPCFICSPDALEKNHEIEFERNKERFLFLKVCHL